MTEYNQSQTRWPIQYRLFKGVKGKYGALRLNLKNAYQNNNTNKPEGVVFLECAPTEGPNNYLWEDKKICIALGLADIGKILLYLRAPNHPSFKEGTCKLYHDKGIRSNLPKGTHSVALNISKPDGYNNFFMAVVETNNKQVLSSVKVPISVAESIVIAKLLESAIPKILAWD